MPEEHMPHSPARPPQSTPRSPRKKKPTWKKVVGRVFTIIGTLVLILAITGSFLACFAAVYIKNVILPKTELNVADYNMDLSSAIYYTDPTTGAVMEYETLHGDQNRVWLRYDQLPQDLIHAAVAIEDRRFYQHHGVDWIRTAKSVLTMFTGGRIQGGSTITQQLIKNLTQYDDVTVKRKVQEIFTALEFDKKYSKDQTLEWYLNYIYFGRKCYGVYTASYAYFGKDVSQLNLAECASLISITNNPSLYDPYTNLENNTTRRGYVLDAMARDGYISQEECDAAKAEELDFHSGQSDGQQSSLYSWYTEQVISDVTKDLMNTYGYSELVASNMVYSSGLKIYACIDPQVQAAVDNIYSNAENLPYTSASGQQLQSAIVVVDTQGNVAALAGKMGEKTVEDTLGYNMASRAQRQPGSSIKPLAVYAPALEMGLVTPYSVFEDGPPMLLNGDPWPSNVNHRYTGQMTVSRAVADSTNTVAVRVLQRVTPEVGFEYLTDKFHIDPNHLVVSEDIKGTTFSDIGYSQMALGGLTKGVTTLDMAGAYAVFPRNGIYVEPRTYSRVEDQNGKILLSKETVGEPVLKEKTVFYINELLKGVVNGGGGSAAALSGMTVAGKTGSTSSNNDRWFVGYTPYYTAAVWVGYRTPERVRVSGDNPAAVLWRKVMSQVHENLENKDFPRPDGLVPVEYCMDTGLRATDECRSDLRGSRAAVGYLYPEDAPLEDCAAHVMTEVCTADPVLKEDGTFTGRYHLAGEFCPEVTWNEDGTANMGKISVAVLDMEREYIGDVHPEDDAYFLSALETVGPCTVHTSEIPVEPVPYDPAAFDITNPSTWPSKEDDPFFDAGDPSTWPSSGGHLPRPGEGEDPTHTPDPGTTTHPDPPVTSEPPVTNFTPPPTLPSAPPDEEPLLPPGA